MSTVRTTCPSCDIVTVRAPELTVRRRAEAETTGSTSEAVFVCPACATEVVHPLNERMIPILIGAGALVDDPAAASRARHPSMGGIDEAEIAAFVASLDRTDWFDQLTN